MSKLIAVSDEAYEKLKRLKNGNSFSKVILGLVDKPKRESLLDIINSWDLKSREKLAKNIEEAHAKMRKLRFKRVEF